MAQEAIPQAAEVASGTSLGQSWIADTSQQFAWADCPNEAAVDDIVEKFKASSTSMMTVLEPFSEPVDARVMPAAAIRDVMQAAVTRAYNKGSRGFATLFHAAIEAADASGIPRTESDEVHVELGPTLMALKGVHAGCDYQVGTLPDVRCVSDAEGYDGGNPTDSDEFHPPLVESSDCHQGIHCSASSDDESDSDGSDDSSAAGSAEPWPRNVVPPANADIGRLPGQPQATQDVEPQAAEVASGALDGNIEDACKRAYLVVIQASKACPAVWKVELLQIVAADGGDPAMECKHKFTVPKSNAAGLASCLASKVGACPQEAFFVWLKPGSGFLPVSPKRKALEACQTRDPLVLITRPFNL